MTTQITATTILASYRDNEIEVKAAKSIFNTGDMIVGVAVWTKDRNGWKAQPTIWCDTEREAIQHFRNITGQHN